VETRSGTAGVNLSGEGDQVFAYQGTVNGTTGVLTGTLLYGFQDNGSGWQDNAGDSNSSALPAGLSGANVAMTQQRDNCAYTGTTTGTRAELLTAINTAANWTCSDDTQPAFPTLFTVTPAAVDLLAFTAERAEGGVQLAWQTGAEIDCGAFRVARCERGAGACAAGDHVELDVTVACQNEPAGATYEFTDATALPGLAYSYYLREYETTGGRLDFGAVLVNAVVLDGVDAETPAQGCAAAGTAAGGAAAFVLFLALVALRRRSA